jgi:hypothetical protein
VDRHRLAVVVENDDLKEPAGPVGADVEVTVALAHYADGVADCVLDALVGNTVLTALSAISTYAGCLARPPPRKLPCAVREPPCGPLPQ